MKFSFVKANATKILLLPLYVAVGLFASVLPRNRRLWVFGRKSGFGEGPLRVLQEVRRRHPDFRLIWMAQSENDKIEAESAGVACVTRKSVAGFVATLRAGVVVLTHGLGDVNRPAAPGAKIIQLWHGTPLKLISLDAPATYRAGDGAVGRLLGAMMLLPYRAAYRTPSVYVAACETSAARFETAFGIPASKILVAGDPRCDCLWSSNGEQARVDARQALAALWGRAALPDRILMYAPTWRDGETDPGVPGAGDWQAIAAACERINAMLVIRSHPHGYGMEDVSLDAEMRERIRFLPATVVNDVTPYLHAIDGLITDYSALAMDYAQLERPIYFFAPDLAAYERTRGLYEPYGEFTEGVWDTCWLQVLSSIEATQPGTPAYHQKIENSRRMKHRYHAYSDGMASSRVVDCVLAATRSAGEA